MMNSWIDNYYKEQQERANKFKEEARLLAEKLESQKTGGNKDDSNEVLVKRSPSTSNLKRKVGEEMQVKLPV